MCFRATAAAVYVEPAFLGQSFFVLGSGNRQRLRGLNLRHGIPVFLHQPMADTLPPSYMVL